MANKDNNDNLALQQRHRLCPTTNFWTAESYINYLIHRKAYEEAGRIVRTKAILDWSCNYGYGLVILEQYGCKALAGLYVSHESTAAARARVAPCVDLILYEGTVVPRPDHVFDVITNFQCIEYSADPAALLAEICRLLKVPGGTAMLTTPNAAIRLDPGMKPWNECCVTKFSPEVKLLFETYFPKVCVRGLFGNEEIQRIEVARCDRARRRARVERGPHVREAVVRMGRTAASGAAGDPYAWRRYSTTDLHYSVENLDSALDLMAVCRL